MKTIFVKSIIFTLLIGRVYAVNPINFNIKLGPSFNNLNNSGKYSAGFKSVFYANFPISIRSSFSFGFGLNKFSDNYFGNIDTNLYSYPGSTSVCSCNYYESKVKFTQFIFPVKYNYFIYKSKLNQFYAFAGFEISYVTEYWTKSIAYRKDSNGTIEYENPVITYNSKSNFNDEKDNVFRRMISLGYKRNLAGGLSFSLEANFSHSKEMSAFDALIGLGIEL